MGGQVFIREDNQIASYKFGELDFVVARTVYATLEHLHVIGACSAVDFHLGNGSISLALYNRLQPAVSPSATAAPTPPVSLPPHTTVGGIQPA